MSQFEKNLNQDTKKEPAIEPTAIIKSIIEQLNYPYRILPKGLTIDEVMHIYAEAVEKGKKEGYTPVLVPEDEILDEYFGILRDEDQYSVEETLKKVGGNGKELLWKYLKEFTEQEEDETFDEKEFLGEMENGEAIDTFSSMIDYGDGEIKQTLLLEIPTKNPWEVVVYVPFGGWNECPVPEEMAAICRYWFEKYGAMPAVITHDTLEFLLPKPIAKDEAMETAKEHAAFCSDRVGQCTESGTVGEVADTLWQSTVWYFWWD